MNKTTRKLSVVRTTMRTLSAASLRNAGAGTGTDTLVTNRGPRGETTFSADIEGGCGDRSTPSIGEVTSCDAGNTCLM
jgi:hypothetical protein